MERRGPDPEKVILKAEEEEEVLACTSHVRADRWTVEMDPKTHGWIHPHSPEAPPWLGSAHGLDTANG